MSNSSNDRQNNLVSFLRHNQPIPPEPHPDLESKLIDSLEPRATRVQPRYLKTAWTIPGAIATGFLFTSVSFGLKTPRIALEPKDLDNFLIKNWQNTVGNSSYAASEKTEAQWLLPNVYESQPTLSVSAQ